LPGPLSKNISKALLKFLPFFQLEEKRLRIEDTSSEGGAEKKGNKIL
jgi:hypothetical protein